MRPTDIKLTRDERALAVACLRTQRFRQAIEFSLPGRLLWQVVGAIEGHEEAGAEEAIFAAHVKGPLEIACKAPFDGMKPRDRAEATQLATLVASFSLNPWRPRPVATITSMMVHWLNTLLDHERLLLVAGSPFEEAIGRYLDPLNEAHAKLLADVDRSGRRNAPLLHERLQAFGFFRDFEFPTHGPAGT